MMSSKVIIVFLLLSGSATYILATPWNGLADENIVWDCNFDNDACHFRNQHNLAKFSRYYNARNLFFDRAGLLLLNLNSPRVQRYPGARLISHYFPSQYENACLYISYRATGSGPESFYVVQQDKENKCIYADHDLQRNGNRWNDIEIQLDLKDGDPRFFLETRFRHGTGYFGIGKFRYGYGRCRRPIGNVNCEKP